MAIVNKNAIVIWNLKDLRIRVENNFGIVIVLSFSDSVWQSSTGVIYAIEDVRQRVTSFLPRETAPNL